MQPWEFSEHILRASSLADIEGSTAQCARSLGFEHHVYVVKMPLPVGPQGQNHFELHNLGNEAWQALYGGWHSAPQEAADVRVKHARAGLPATTWSVDAGVAYTRPDLARNARGLLRAAHNVGLRGGVTVPIWSPGVSWGLMTFSTDATSNLRDLAPMVAPALYLASCLNVSLRRTLEGPQSGPTLSDREREILQWAALGKSSWDISRILSISEHTVNYHLQRVAKRLNVRGRQAACARALALDLIVL